jgi:trehalose utilization protein
VSRQIAGHGHDGHPGRPQAQLTEEVLGGTDVLAWWGHAAHEKVEDAVVNRVQEHMLGGAGLVVLQSGRSGLQA